MTRATRASAAGVSYADWSCSPLLRQGHQRGLVRAKKHGTKSGTGAPLRRRFSCVAGPNRLKVTAAQLVLRGFSDAEMGIDLRDRRLGDSHRRPACPVVAPWARELIRPLGTIPRDHHLWRSGAESRCLGRLTQVGRFPDLLSGWRYYLARVPLLDTGAPPPGGVEHLKSSSPIFRPPNGLRGSRGGAAAGSTSV